MRKSVTFFLILLCGGSFTIPLSDNFASPPDDHIEIKHATPPQSIAVTEADGPETYTSDQTGYNDSFTEAPADTCIPFHDPRVCSVPPEPEESCKLTGKNIMVIAITTILTAVSACLLVRYILNQIGRNAESVRVEFGPPIPVQSEVDIFLIRPKRGVVTDKCLRLDSVIGEGEFGVVQKGILTLPDRIPGLDVAIKKMKGTDDSTFLTMRNEISVLIGLEDHRNVLSLIGFSDLSSRPMIITELCELSLEKFLADRKRELIAAATPDISFDEIFLSFAYQIASGMEFLESNEIIHRDLAPRNILVVGRCVKICDFGISLQKCKPYRLHIGFKIPWRRSSLESLMEHAFSTKSDVWMFGIVLWEIWTMGERPFQNIGDYTALIVHLCDGSRLDPGATWPLVIQELIRSCCLEEPKDRPTFTAIAEAINSPLMSISGYTFVLDES